MVRPSPIGASRLQEAWALGRFHIVGIAAAATFTFGWLFTGRYLWSLALVSALDWFFVNLLNRVVDLPEDRVNAARGTDLAARHHRGILVGGVGGLVASLVVFHLVAPAVTPLRLAYHLLGFAYNWPLWPGARRLKQLYFWKNTASAGGFLLTVFAYPLAAVGLPRGLAPGIDLVTVALAALFFLQFEVGYEIIYDLRDVAGDARAGVRTYPVVHGVRVAARIVDVLLVGAMATLIGGYLAGLVPWRLCVMAVAPAIQLVYYKWALRRGLRAADCVRLTWLGAALLGLFHLWVLAGLPGVGS